MAAKEKLSIQARTGARRREATRAEIVDAVRRLLLRGDSFASLSMDGIAREAAMSRATLYLHFSDKRDILACLAEELLEQRFALGAELLASPEVGRDVFDNVVAQLVDRWMRDAPLLDAIIVLAEEDENMRRVWVAALHELGDMGAGLMQGRWAEGPSAYPDPQTLGRVLAWMFERSTHQLTRDPGQRDAVVEAISEVLWRVFDYRPTAG